jgi:hypothetical protein
MPLKRGKEHVGENIREMHDSKVYRRTRRKYGKQRADRQAVAAGMHGAGLGRMVAEKWG